MSSLYAPKSPFTVIKVPHKKPELHGFMLCILSSELWFSWQGFICWGWCDVIGCQKHSIVVEWAGQGVPPTFSSSVLVQHWGHVCHLMEDEVLAYVNSSLFHPHLLPILASVGLSSCGFHVVLVMPVGFSDSVLAHFLACLLTDLCTSEAVIC